MYAQYTQVRGHPFMKSTKNPVFDPPPPVHMRPHGPDPPPLWTSTRGRHEIHTALLKRLVPDLKLKFDYMIVIYLTVLLVIYITNLGRRKIFTCYSVQRRNSVRCKNVHARAGRCTFSDFGERTSWLWPSASKFESKQVD